METTSDCAIKEPVQPGAKTGRKFKNALVSGDDKQLPGAVVDGAALTAATEMMFNREA